MDIHHRRTKALLYLTAVFFFWASLYFYVPTLPVYLQTRSDSLAMIGVVISMYGLWQGLARLPIGIAADRLGRRKPFVLVCFGFSALGAWIMSSAGDINGMLLGRGITGLAAAGWVPLVVLFSGLFPAREAVQASAILSLVNFISRMCATGLTGVLNDTGGYPLAFTVSIFAALAAALVILPVPEERREEASITPGAILELIRRGDVALPSLLGAVNQYAVFATCYGFFPILARDLGADSFLQGEMATLALAGMTVGSLTAAAARRRFKAPRMTLASFGLLAGGVALGGAARSLEGLFAAQALVGFASGVGYPILMGLSIQEVTDAERATAMGVFQSVYALGMFGGPWLSGMLAETLGVPLTMYVTALLVAILGVGGAIPLIRHFQKKEPYDLT